MMVTQAYEKAIALGDIVDDPGQREVVLFFEKLSAHLSEKKPWFSWKKSPLIKGLYLYGSVGVGKTFLMDLFYDNTQLLKKKRFHFHQFMQQIDLKLRRLQGHKNPLKRIAADIAESTQVLCFDEFMVDDVAYAMILAELLNELFAKNVILVATSNTAPQNLYQNGVHRERFLPAITGIQSHCDVLFLENEKDYRLNLAVKVDTYLFPLDKAVYLKLLRQFETLAVEGEWHHQLMVQKREIPCIACRGAIVWFDFKVICNLPRSQLDYLEIANRFHTIVISDMPLLTEKDTVLVILFMHFIDVLYDRGIRLILSAAGPIDKLYQQGELHKEFERASSRLQEMQSVDYLRRHPRRTAEKFF